MAMDLKEKRIGSQAIGACIVFIGSFDYEKGSPYCQTLFQSKLCRCYDFATIA
jgi:hypothetical protein